MKEKFINSTIILVIGGILTKLLGMIIKMFLARNIGVECLGLYMLILPTFILFIQLSQFGLPITFSKLIAEEKRNNKKLFFSILPILIIVNILFCLLIIFISPFIATKLLHNKNLITPIKAMALVIPFTSISNVCRAYFFGKQKMIPHVISNICEDLIRLFLLIILIPTLNKYTNTTVITFLILLNVISEITSTIILLLYLPKKISIKKDDFIPSKYYIKDSLNISIPHTTSHFISSIGYFLEPFLITTLLLKTGYSLKFITTEYAILSGYVMPLVLLPAFFTVAISQALLPVISKLYVNNNYQAIINKLKLACFISLIITIPMSISLLIWPHKFLNIIYHTNKGVKYIRLLAPFLLLEYLEAPFISTLDAIGKSKCNLEAISIGTIFKVITLILLSKLHIGLWPLPLANIIYILITFYYLIKKVRFYLT